MVSTDQQEFKAATIEPGDHVAWAAAWREFPRHLRQSLRQQSVLILIILAYLLYHQFAANIFGLNSFEQLSPASYYLSKMVIIFFAFYLAGYFILAIIKDKPERLFPFCWAKLKREVLVPQRVAMALPLLILMPPFFSAFSSLKTMIPLIQPFTWDPLFMEWDRALHFGRHPYEWLQPLLGYPLVTKALNLGYLAWVMIINTVLLWQTMSMSNPALRLQFLLTYSLSWILIGTLGGTLLSSAGPCFYALVGGDPTVYEPLLSYLAELGDAGPAPVQEWLWGTYQEGVAKNFAGISAMPSMHVAMVVLLVLLARQINKWLLLAAILYAVMIFLGSIQLAWHYAIDGYFSGACVLALWWGVGWFVKSRKRGIDC